MLTRTLRLLERDGMVERTVVPTTPPQVWSALTPLGTSLVEPLDALTAWALAHRDDVQATSKHRHPAGRRGDGLSGPGHGTIVASEPTGPTVDINADLGEGFGRGG